MPNVLLVDDDASILYVLQQLVSRRGWRALTAASGMEALEVVDRADAVVTDYRMPGLDGLQLIGAIRQRGAAVPIIMLTGDHSQALAQQALCAGACACLPKPLPVDELVSTLARAVEEHRRAA